LELQYFPTNFSFQRSENTMTQTINKAALTRYAQAYAQRTCDTFFARQDTILGKDIVSFTDIPQVNYFILFKLFNNWQQEAEKLQSPYFDYSPEEVKTALEQLMNTLSRHIQVNRQAFEPLVASATASTLQLLLTPREQFISLLKDIDFQPLTSDRLQEHTRYIRINRPIWEAVLTTLKISSEATDVLPLDKAIAALDDVLATGNTMPEQPETYLPQFSAQVPLQLSDLQQPDLEDMKAAPEKRDPPRSFFDSLPDDVPISIQTVSVPVTPAPEPGTPVSQAVSGQQPITLPPVSPPDVQEVKVEEVKIDIEQFAKAANKPLLTVLSVKQKSEGITLNDTLNRTEQTLNDKLRKEETSLIDKAQNQRIISIKEALNLNQKYYFINSLFGGDNVAFAQAVHELEQAPGLHAAMQLIELKHTPALDWDTRSDEYKAFVDVIERRFSQ